MEVEGRGEKEGGREKGQAG